MDQHDERLLRSIHQFGLAPPQDAGSRAKQDARRFLQDIVEVSERHRRQGKALFFAIIFSRTTDAAVAKMLGDADYWQALDHETGRYATLFSPPPIVERHSPHIGWESEYPPARRHPIARLLRLFMIDDKPKLPCIAFFQVGNGLVMDGFSLPLEAARVEDLHDEVRKLFVAAREGLSQLKRENSGNYQEIFNLVKVSVRGASRRKRFFSLADKSMPVAKVLSSLLGLSR